MTRKQLIQLALDNGFTLAEVKQHLKVYPKPKKPAKKKLSRNNNGPRIFYGMNTNAM